MNHHRSLLWGSFLILLLLSSCQPPANEPARPQDPWVIRSVLDNRSRMVTLALHEDGFAAYDTERCGLYKVWRGGVLMEGVAYTNVKELQPTSWGHAYLEDPDRTPVWFLEQGGEKKTLQPQFRGYRLENNRITFTYELKTADDQTLTVYEQPEFFPENKGEVAYLRTFRTENVPAGSTLYYGETALKSNARTDIRLTFDPVPTSEAPDPSATSSRGRYWLDKSGCNTCHEVEATTVGPGYRQIAARYPRTKENIRRLAQKVQTGGSGVWGEVLMNPHPHLEIREIEEMVRYILSLQPAKEEETKTQSTDPKPQPKAVSAAPEKQPGFGSPLESIHPSYDLITIRPEDFRPRVGALDFMPDGRLLVTTWDTVGGVYLLSGVETGDAGQVQVKRIAAGLGEPLGIKVVDNEIFVLQKQELTQLIDHDGDEIIDEYRTICNSWGATTDFHEFACGLVYKDGYFYATLGLAMRLMAHETQHPDRGTAIRISRNGQYEIIADGLRQANGIGIGPEGEIFLTENQGQWVPANKVIHLREGDFHGCQFGTGDKYAGREMTPPTVWLPQDEIGNSPSQPVTMQDGPYLGQLLHGEVTHGGIKRVFLEEVDGAYQGCVFRFTQGLEAGVNRLVWGPDGRLYVGGIGMVGNWSWQGKQYGLQALAYNERSTFEMLAVRAIPDGLEVEFTEPLAEGQGEKPADYTIQQWRYEVTPAYGGPKLDLESLPVSRVALSDDRRKARLYAPGCKERHVLHLQLSPALRSASGQTLWSGDCWYTMNAIPQEEIQ